MPDAIDMRAEAVALAEAGFRVFPLRRRGKRPLEGSHGFKDACSDPERVASMWASTELNIGIATGDGRCVVDIDQHDEDGWESMRAWEREHGDLPETVCAETGSGGEHLWFTVPEGVHIASRSGVLPGVDVRCEGGYVVAPPSIHPDTGRPYAWQIAPGEMDMAAMPPALMELLLGGQREGADGLTRFDPPEGEIRKGGRDDDLFRFASKLRSNGFPEAEAEAACLERDRARYRPPLGERYVRTKVRQVYARYRDGHSDGAGRAGARGDGQRSQPQHVAMADALLNGYSACYIDGMPAVRMRDGRWDVGDDAFERAMVEVSRGVKRATRRETAELLRLEAPQVEQAPYRYVAFKNAVVDAETREEVDGSGMVLPNRIPWDWDPSAECAAVDAVLERMACGDAGLQMNLIETMGLCMARTSRFAVAPILLGRGSNGKSTYLDMLMALLGRRNYAALDLKAMANRFNGVMLVGKLANIGDDVSGEYLDGDACAVIKRVAAGNEMFTDVKGSKGYAFRPYCTPVFSANTFPRLGDTTDGMYRRLHPMGFNARFSPSDPDFDPNIADKLTSREACEYMCVLGMEGLRRVMASNGMTPNADSERIKREIRLDNSTVLQWLADVGGDVDGMTRQAALQDYRSWCRDNGNSYPLSGNVFKKEMERNGITLSGFAKDINGKTMRVYRKEG